MKKLILLTAILLFAACSKDKQVQHLYPIGSIVKLTYKIPGLVNPIRIDSLYSPVKDYSINTYYGTDANGKVWAGLDDRYLKPW